MNDKELKALINTIKNAAGRAMKCLSIKVERHITEYAEWVDIYIYAECVDGSWQSNYYSLHTWLSFADM